MSWHRKLPNQAACGSCCGIKEKLQTLWDRTINSILRINQVEPDDQGNIRIRSDNEALTVTGGTNEIILNLDTSELPAASVVTVNGKRGYVVLKAEDITDSNNLTLQHDLDAIANDIQGVRNSVSTETQNRQDADTALQNNINTLQASIPQEAADAVAADPTVQSFAAAAADIPNKVDKRTGAGLRAYTHTGSTQDDTVVEDSTNGATIPIRDANGRLHAADPASGATDKTIVTANWVSQTGAGAPNNLLHRNGNETKSGTMTFNDPVYGRLIKPLYENYSGAMPGGKYRIFAKIPAAMSNTMAYLDVMTSANGFNFAFGILLVGNPTSTSWICRWALRKDNGGFLTANAIQIAKETATGDLLVFAKNPTYTGLSINLRYAKSGSSIHGADRIVAYYDGVDYTLDGSDAGITDIVAGVDMQ